MPGGPAVGTPPAEPPHHVAGAAGEPEQGQPNPEAWGLRAKRGRDPIAQEFPGFDEGPHQDFSYPGYESIDALPETGPQAKAVIVLGALAVLLFPIGVLPGGLALLLSPGARRQIRRSHGELEGRGLVRIGAVLSAVGIALCVLTGLVGAVLLLR